MSDVLELPLDTAAKRALIAAELDADPDRSDREIARIVGCDHKTIAATRRRLGLLTESVEPQKSAEIDQLTPPASMVKLVMAHRKRLEAERDRALDGVAELALRSAMGDMDARTELRSLPTRLAGFGRILKCRLTSSNGLRSVGQPRLSTSVAVNRRLWMISLGGAMRT